jgi:3-deoxy-D-manno-octulosonate 8-phosphate phosphatase (KDO 8-P phosphatase)
MQDIIERAKLIKLLILDVDGVLTTGDLYYTDSNIEYKIFNTLDGHGIKMLQKTGVIVAIISGRQSDAVTKRAQDLGIKYVYQGKEDKCLIFNELLIELHLQPTQVAYMGDDLPDLPLICQVGLGIAVSNAHNFIKQHAHLTTQTSGGKGAVREVCDMLMQAQDTFSTFYESYLR